MEHNEVLASAQTEAELRAAAEEHAGTALTWEVGETEGTFAFALHPGRPAEYLVCLESALD